MFGGQAGRHARRADDETMDTPAARVAMSMGVSSLLSHATTRLMRSICPPVLHPEVSRYRDAVAAQPSLCAEVGQLAKLGQDERFRDIVRLVADVIALATHPAPGNEFKIARASNEISCRLREIVDETRAWESDDLFNEQRIAREDTVPTVERQLESMLHNYIVDRR